jgi:hypothetical protein
MKVSLGGNSTTSSIGWTSEMFYSAGTRDLRLQMSAVDKFQWLNGPMNVDLTTGVYGFGVGGADTGMSRISATVIGVGNGTQGNVSGQLDTSGYILAEAATPTNVASSGILWEDSTSHELQAKTNGSALVGLVARVQPGVIHQTAQTAAISTATLCAASAGACNVAGTYTVEWAFWQEGTACATNTTGGVTFLLTWTDSNGTVHSAQGLAMDDSLSLVATTGTFHFNQTGNGLGTVWASGNFNLSSNGSIIQYATTFSQCSVSGTATYGLDISVTRKR